MGILSMVSVSRGVSVRYRSPAKDVEKIACNGFSVFRNLMLVDISLQRGHKFVAVLFNDKSDELLGHHQLLDPRGNATVMIYLSHVNICLHD